MNKLSSQGQPVFIALHVEGTFHVQSGSVDFDRFAPGIAGTVVVAAGNRQRAAATAASRAATRRRPQRGAICDRDLRAQELSGTIAPSGDSTIQLTVIFTLHGTPHDLTVPIRLHFDGANLTTDTYFTLLYMKWGLKDPSMFILKVAKDVDMDLTLAGQVTP